MRERGEEREGKEKEEKKTKEKKKWKKWKKKKTSHLRAGARLVAGVVAQVRVALGVRLERAVGGELGLGHGEGL